MSYKIKLIIFSRENCENRIPDCVIQHVNSLGSRLIFNYCDSKDDYIKFSTEPELNNITLPLNCPYSVSKINCSLDFIFAIIIPIIMIIAIITICCAFSAPTPTQTQMPLPQTPTSISSRPIIKNISLFSSKYRDNDCAICLLKLNNNLNISEMPCSHIFHAKCLETWLISKSTCPVCRKDSKNV